MPLKWRRRHSGSKRAQGHQAGGRMLPRSQRGGGKLKSVLEFCCRVQTTSVSDVPGWMNLAALLRVLWRSSMSDLFDCQRSKQLLCRSPPRIISLCLSSRSTLHSVRGVSLKTQCLQLERWACMLPFADVVKYISRHNHVAKVARDIHIPLQAPWQSAHHLHAGRSTPVDALIGKAYVAALNLPHDHYRDLSLSFFSLLGRPTLQIHIFWREN
jgi:hypothetical protein